MVLKNTHTTITSHSAFRDGNTMYIPFIAPKNSNERHQPITYFIAFVNHHVVVDGKAPFYKQELTLDKSIPICLNQVHDAPHDDHRHWSITVLDEIFEPVKKPNFLLSIHGNSLGVNVNFTTNQEDSHYHQSYHADFSNFYLYDESMLLSRKLLSKSATSASKLLALGAGGSMALFRAYGFVLEIHQPVNDKAFFQITHDEEYDLTDSCSTPPKVMTSLPTTWNDVSFLIAKHAVTSCIQYHEANLAA